MTAIAANELATTHLCKQPGCENEARSAVGRYSYCAEHQAERAAAKPATSTNGHVEGAEKALRDLLSLAKRVDKAKAKAEKLQAAANIANREADRIEREYREKLSAAIQGA